MVALTGTAKTTAAATVDPIVATDRTAVMAPRSTTVLTEAIAGAAKAVPTHTQVTRKSILARKSITSMVIATVATLPVITTTMVPILITAIIILIITVSTITVAEDLALERDIMAGGKA